MKNWYTSFSKPDNPCASHYTARLSIGFPLPDGLNTKLIEFDTGGNGVLINPIKAANYVFQETDDKSKRLYGPVPLISASDGDALLLGSSGDRSEPSSTKASSSRETSSGHCDVPKAPFSSKKALDEYLSYAFGDGKGARVCASETQSKFKPETPQMLTTQHQCQCVLHTRGMRASYDTQTGVAQIEWPLVARSCSGDLYDLSAEFTSPFDEALREVVTPQNPEVAAIGWQGGKLSELLVEDMVKAAEQVFTQTGLDKDCSRIVGATGPELIWRSPQFRTAEGFEAVQDWAEAMVLDDKLLSQHPSLFVSAAREMQASLRPRLLELPNVTKTQQDTAIRKCIDETFEGIMLKQHAYLDRSVRDCAQDQLAVHTLVDVIPHEEVPNYAKTDKGESFYIRSSGVLFCLGEVTGDSAIQTDWNRYTAIPQGETVTLRPTGVVRQHRLGRRWKGLKGKERQK